MKKTQSLLLALLTIVLASCSTIDVNYSQQTLNKDATWAVLPIVNHTDAPQAGLRAEAIAEAMLRTRGIENVERYPAEMNADTVFEPAGRKAVDQALDWAAKQQVRYAVTGTVDEWRYKVGVDGEPVVGLVMQIINMENRAVVWSAVGAKSGWSRESVSSVAQELLGKMFNNIPLAE